jgi:CelD/BcsL family acetyltransferase involved in cellulose biosynthesis
MTQASPIRLEAHIPAGLDRTSLPRETSLAAEKVSGRIRVKVYENLEEAEAVWRYCERSADCTIFQSYDWVRVWHRHIGTRNKLRPAIVVVHEGDSVLMLLPLALRRTGLIRRLTWLGGEFCDYWAPLLAPDFSRRVAQDRFADIWLQVTAHLQQLRKFRHDLVELERMPEYIGAQPNPFCTLKVQLNPSGAYLTQLVGSWDEFYAAKRSSATRRRDRTKRKRLAEQGEIRLVTAEDSVSATLTLQTLFEQKTASFARMGVRNIFEPPGHREFLLDLASEPKSRHLTHVSRLEIGSTIAAANLGLLFHGRYYHLLASHDDGELSRFGSTPSRRVAGHSISLSGTSAISRIGVTPSSSCTTTSRQLACGAGPWLPPAFRCAAPSGSSNKPRCCGTSWSGSVKRSRRQSANAHKSRRTPQKIEAK